MKCFILTKKFSSASGVTSTNSRVYTNKRDAQIEMFDSIDFNREVKAKSITSTEDSLKIVWNNNTVDNFIITESGLY